MTKEHLGEGPRERHGDSRFWVQLIEDGDDSTRERWMKRNDLWLIFDWERQGISHLLSQVNQLFKTHLYCTVFHHVTFVVCDVIVVCMYDSIYIRR